MSSDVSGAEALIVNSDENRALIQTGDKCDKYDYLIAVACGAIGGMIDIFLVGAPGDSKLNAWTDAQVDNAVKGFAKIIPANTGLLKVLIAYANAVDPSPRSTPLALESIPQIAVKKQIGAAIT